MISCIPFTRLFTPHTVNLQEVRKGLSELREGYKRLRQELDEHHADVGDRFSKQMWNFAGHAGRQLEDLTDDVNAADTSYTEVAQFYGEDEKGMTSSEFYGVFKTFVTSYRVRPSHNGIVRTLTRHHRNVKPTTAPWRKNGLRKSNASKLLMRQKPTAPRPERLLQALQTARRILRYSTTSWKSYAKARILDEPDAAVQAKGASDRPPL